MKKAPIAIFNKDTSYIYKVKQHDLLIENGYKKAVRKNIQSTEDILLISKETRSKSNTKISLMLRQNWKMSRLI